ncbi:MAG: peptide deformylase [Proteobacteria bacterium]|nr:peptide deformylase [Pseudomonadota bacterium]
MTVYKVLTYPDPFLKTVATPVTEFDNKLKEISDNMIETMYENAGIGLAAVQIGFGKRLFVMDVTYSKELPESARNPMVIINPEIIEKSEEQVNEEGCLSVPEFRAEVKRSGSITLKYQDVEGNEHTMEASGLKSICIQHEMDHLEGKLFIDYLPSLQRNMIRKKLKKRYA